MVFLITVTDVGCANVVCDPWVHVLRQGACTNNITLVKCFVKISVTMSAGLHPSPEGVGRLMVTIQFCRSVRC